MKHEVKYIYSAPEIEVLEVAIEQGFAQSNGDSGPGGIYPGWPGGENPL